MPTVTSLPGIAASESERLKKSGYSDVDRLWEAVAQNGLAVPSERAKIAPARLAELLGAFEIMEVRGARTPGRDHLSGLLLQVAWTVLLAVAIAGSHFLVLRPLSRIGSTRDVATYAVVATADGLPAYNVMSNEQIAVRIGPMTDRDLAVPGSIAGRYALQPLAAGAVVRSSHLSARRLPSGALEGRKVLSFSAPAIAMPDVSVPEPVTLVFSPLPSAWSADAEIVEGLLLVARRTADRATLDVAVKESDLPRIARVAGQSQLLVATKGSSAR